MYLWGKHSYGQPLHGISAKLMAVLRCTELFLTKNITKRRIHICSGSRADLAALAKTTTELFSVWECMQTLGRLSELNKVTLVWIPRHQVDRLAKEGAI